MMMPCGPGSARGGSDAGRQVTAGVGGGGHLIGHTLIILEGKALFDRHTGIIYLPL